jgi:DNA polymerase zeta
MFVHVLPRARNSHVPPQHTHQTQQQQLLHDAFDRMHEFTRVCNAALPNPMELELEKIFLPCILVTKKRYVGMAFESVKQEEGSLDAKGIESVRRDTCALVQVCRNAKASFIHHDARRCNQDVLEQSLRLLFSTRNLSVVRHHVEDTFGRLLRGEVPLQQLAFAKEVRLGTYRAPPPAAQLAARRLINDSAAITLYGERVSFVVVYGPPAARLCDCVMPPLEVSMQSAAGMV